MDDQETDEDLVDMICCVRKVFLVLCVSLKARWLHPTIDLSSLPMVNWKRSL